MEKDGQFITTPTLLTLVTIGRRGNITNAVETKETVIVTYFERLIQCHLTTVLDGRRLVPCFPGMNGESDATDRDFRYGYMRGNLVIHTRRARDSGVAGGGQWS